MKKRIYQHDDITIKILTDQDPDLINTLKTLSLHHQKFEFGIINEKIQSQVIIIIIDSEYVLAIESKDVSNNFDGIDESNDTGIAIYSNSKYTVMSYDSISESFWMRAELENA